MGKNVEVIAHVHVAITSMEMKQKYIKLKC